jgi:hypothetical protein
MAGAESSRRQVPGLRWLPRPEGDLYRDWHYVFVKAGPQQALTWRTGHMRHGSGSLPDLFFPADRSWLVSALWDDTWTCIGGPANLINTSSRIPWPLPDEYSPTKTLYRQD